MIEMMIEVIIIVGTLLFAVCIAQGAVAAGFLSTVLSFSPMEVLSLIVVLWFSYVIAMSKIFDRLIGE